MDRSAAAFVPGAAEHITAAKGVTVAVPISLGAIEHRSVCGWKGTAIANGCNKLAASSPWVETKLGKRSCEPTGSAASLMNIDELVVGTANVSTLHPGELRRSSTKHGVTMTARMLILEVALSDADATESTWGVSAASDRRDDGSSDA